MNVFLFFAGVTVGTVMFAIANHRGPPFGGCGGLVLAGTSA